MSALAGLRVIELANERIALAGKLLGDMGADVILVEPPGGDPARRYAPFVDDIPGPDRSLYWWHYNTSKRSVVLDLDTAADRDRFRALLRGADILLESEPVRRLADLGLDYADLASANPGLLHAAVTPYGRRFPDSDLPCTDLTVLAGGGPVWSNGYDDHALPPVRGGGNQGWNIGCHYAVMALLTALLHRMATGEGQFIDVSFHAAANVTTEAASFFWLGAKQTVQRQTGRHAMVQPTIPVQVRCADGRYVNSGVPPRFPEEFQRLLAWLDKLGIGAEFPERVFLEQGAQWQGAFDIMKVGVDDEITAIFGAGREGMRLIASKLPAYEFFIGCQEMDLAAGIIYSPEEAIQDPHFQARGMQVPIEHPEIGRTVHYPGAPYVLPASPWRIARRAPRLGEHDDEVFGAL
ncbi:MAG: CaiB/BaiF CoA transferase family protein [Gammaproteobacteria bacterium]